VIYESRAMCMKKKLAVFECSSPPFSSSIPRATYTTMAMCPRILQARWTLQPRKRREHASVLWHHATVPRFCLAICQWPCRYMGIVRHMARVRGVSLLTIQPQKPIFTGKRRQYHKRDAQGWMQAACWGLRELKASWMLVVSIDAGVGQNASKRAQGPGRAFQRPL